MKNWAHLFWKVSCEVLIHARVPENDISDIRLIQADTLKHRPGQAVLIMTSTRGVNPGPANNPALLYHCRTQLQQRLTDSKLKYRLWKRELYEIVPGVSIIFKIRVIYKAWFEGFEFFIVWPYAVFHKMQVVFYKSAHFMYLWRINSVFAKCGLQYSKILK